MCIKAKFKFFRLLGVLPFFVLLNGCSGDKERGGAEDQDQSSFSQQVDGSETRDGLNQGVLFPLIKSSAQEFGGDNEIDQEHVVQVLKDKPGLWVIDEVHEDLFQDSYSFFSSELRAVRSYRTIDPKGYLVRESRACGHKTVLRDWTTGQIFQSFSIEGCTSKITSLDPNHYKETVICEGEANSIQEINYRQISDIPEFPSGMFELEKNGEPVLENVGEVCTTLEFDSTVSSTKDKDKIVLSISGYDLNGSLASMEVIFSRRVRFENFREVEAGIPEVKVNEFEPGRYDLELTTSFELREELEVNLRLPGGEKLEIDEGVLQIDEYSLEGISGQFSFAKGPDHYVLSFFSEI